MCINYLIDIQQETPLLEPGDSLCVSVPGELVCSLQVELPPLPSKNRELVIGYAIEDKIATHLDDIKLFCPTQPKQGPSTVLWCLRRHWETWLKQTDDNVVCLLPDYLYLPLETDCWTIRCEGERTLMRSGENIGLSLETDLFNNSLSLLLSQHDPLPETILFDGNAVPETIKACCKQHGIKAIARKLPRFSAPSKHTFSLLPATPFDWRQLKPTAWKNLNKRWKLACGLTAAWVVILITGSVWEQSALNQAMAQNTQMLQSIYQKAKLTGASAKNNIPELEHLRKSLERGLTPDSSLHMLNRVSSVIQAYPGVKLLNFILDDKSLSLRLSTPSANVLDKVVKKLTELNLDPKRSDLLIQQGQTLTTLVLRRK